MPKTKVAQLYDGMMVFQRTNFFIDQHVLEGHLGIEYEGKLMAD